MKLRQVLIIAALAIAAVVAVCTVALDQPGGEIADDTSSNAIILAEGVPLESTADAEQRQVILSVVDAGEAGSETADLTIDYPLTGSIFPPKMIAPTFLWHDSDERADRWVIDIALNDGAGHIYELASGDPPPEGWIDPKCLGETNEAYTPTAYQASARSWTPDPVVWSAIKAASSAQPATVTIIGFSDGEADRALSLGRMTLTTSTDHVGAPIFYRDVPLMPAIGDQGTIRPLASSALPLIAWRLKDISRPDSRIVLTDMPTCGNCHSFSADGRTLGMDIDGPSGDKGAYAVVAISKNIVVEAKDIITWNDFPDKPEGHKTIGFLSRVSPDGQHVMTTVNESVYVINFTDYRFLQVFYPTRGILAYYSRRTGQMKALPGADDTAYAHCDPVWSPDGEWIVFARTSARDASEEGRALPRRANDDAELPVQYDLYRIRFNEGRGGEPERIEGASANGMSNTFPKVSPDGKWVVFVKCRNGQLMRPDSELWIVPLTGGQARRMTCNTRSMNSWHSFSPNGRWMVFSSKANTPYTQMFLTHIDEDGNDSPPILIPNATAANRAVNIPEFVNIDYDDLLSMRTPTVEYYRHYERGVEHMMAGRPREAIAEFNKALEAEPTSVRINGNIGRCLMELDQVEAAKRYFNNALDTDPSNWIVLTSLASALIREREYDEAVVLLRRAIEIEPKYPWAHYNLGHAIARQGDIDEAVGHFRKAVEIMPQTNTHQQLGRALAQQGQLDEAVEHLREAIRLDPNNSVARNDLARVLGAVQQRD